MQIRDKIDENFNIAMEIYEGEFSHNELINMLKCGDIVQKQISVLKLDTLINKEEAELLVSNLIGQNGKVREAVSFKLTEYMSQNELLPHFMSTKNYDVFLNSIIDINGNICRNIISAISNLKSDKDFCDYFCEKLTEMTLDLTHIINDFDFQDGKYKVNKEVFKLYWCLETIFEFSDFMNIDSLKEILTKTKNINEYTIREKTAKILTKNFTDFDLLKIKQELKNDPNYYVRRY